MFDGDASSRFPDLRPRSLSHASEMACQIDKWNEIQSISIVVWLYISDGSPSV